MRIINKFLRDERAFTLVELIVVIAVLGILSGIAIPRLTGVQDKARYAAGEALLANLKTPLELYRVEKGNYPDITDDNYGELNTALSSYVDNFSSLLPESSDDTDSWYFSGYTYTESDNSFELTISHNNDSLDDMTLDESGISQGN